MQARLELIGQQNSTARQRMHYRTNKTEPHKRAERFIRDIELNGSATPLVAQRHAPETLRIRRLDVWHILDVPQCPQHPIQALNKLRIRLAESRIDNSHIRRVQELKDPLSVHPLSEHVRGKGPACLPAGGLAHHEI